jgi:hypothetical protein
VSNVVPTLTYGRNRAGKLSPDRDNLRGSAALSLTDPLVAPILGCRAATRSILKAIWIASLDEETRQENVPYWAQYRNEVTLGYLPGKLDQLLTAVQPGALDAELADRNQEMLPVLHAFQRRLSDSVQKRFAVFFDGSSLALAARYLLPGTDLFTFTHFDVPGATLDQVVENLLDDYVTLLPSTTSEALLGPHKVAAGGVLQLARELLNGAAADVDPLQWWPQQQHLASLFPLVKMMLAVPASSADNERSFSSASYTLGIRRTRLELETFRAEHRIRRFLVGCADLHSQAGRQRRLDRMNRLLEQYAALVAERLHPQ